MKIEKIQERALRFMFNDKTYKNYGNRCFMNQMFEAKTISYDLRNSYVLFQPKWNKARYGKHTLKNNGSHIWSLLPN